MQPTLREALTSKTRQYCFAAFQIILWSRDYDLLPALLNLVGGDRDGAERQPHADLGRRTVLELAELLFDELHAARPLPKRRDPQACRRHAVACLETFVRGGARPPGEVVEAYVMLCRREDAGLRQILHDPHDPLRDVVLRTLGHSHKPGVLRLLASFVDDSHPPLTVLRLLSSRGDVEFVAHLLGRLGDALSSQEAENLRRLESLAWASPTYGTLDALDGEAQRRAVTFILGTSISYAAKFKALAHLVHHGQAAGRRATVTALVGFHSPQADDLVLGATSDEDAHVQAAALAQLRQRNVPGAIPLLIERAESPHEAVRQAVRESLSEFRFERFMTSYDTLSEEVRRSTGKLVRQIDPDALPRLRAELTSPSRLRRTRAMEIAEAMEALADVEPELLTAAADEDLLVRAEAARVLAMDGTPAAAAMPGHENAVDTKPIPRAPMCHAAGGDR
jgi:HEAT repeat protein